MSNLEYRMEPSNNKRDGNSCNIRCFTLFYAMCVALFSALLFLYGFFPLKLNDEGIATMEDVPTHVEHVRALPSPLTQLKTRRMYIYIRLQNSEPFYYSFKIQNFILQPSISTPKLEVSLKYTSRVNNELLYKPLIKKLVIMVIDGLRWDFVAGSIGQAAMPITRKLIENNTACLLQTKAGSPTVTMPRIKAITTGSAPTFVDVVLNFGSKSVSGDSLLLQAKNHGHKLIFYGDDTWLKLFPDIFHRSDGTTSFFVTDYTEVDNNVTRHIDEELNKTDWSIMVLHYLGLDHIGHTGGPQSPLIKPKLREMDEIVGKIQARIAHWNEPTLFVVCGDHGMRDSGGHGGNTPQETLVPFVAIGASCSGNNNEPIEMAQVDISSTIAILLGIPIPSSNLGSVSLHILNELSISRKLFSLYYNAKQVFNHFKQLAGFQATRAYEQYANAIKLHSVWLEASGPTTEAVDEIVHLYHGALREMRDELTSSMSKYDLHAMRIAMFFMFHALYIMMNIQEQTKPMTRKVVHFLLVNGILWISVDYLWEGASESLLLTNDTSSNSLLAVIAIILLANCYLSTKFKLSIDYMKKQLTKGGTTQCLLFSGTLIHALSLVSSSFVEEEHRTWYFFWTTFCLILLYQIIRSLVAQSPSHRYYNISPRAQISVKLFLCLLAHAILRHLNSTGDMYAHLPDIADWLQQQESKISMTILLISALSSLVWIGYTYEETKYKKYSLMMYISLSSCIYLRHMVTGAVARLPFYPISKGIYEVHVFWCSMLVFLMFALLRLGNTVKRNRRTFLSLLLRFVVQSWVMVSAMLHRPYNVGLLPIQLLFSIIIYSALRNYEKRDAVVQVHYWLGNVFYFYQGNSNNLSTIDVAAGYVGMESYNPYITGLFLTINTYSAPVLAYFTLLSVIVSENKNPKSRDDILEINRRYAICRLLPLAVYTIVITIQRYHLFVWTVFSPKLLYEAMYCAVMYFVMFTMNLTSVLHDKINRY